MLAPVGARDGLLANRSGRARRKQIRGDRQTHLRQIRQRDGFVNLHRFVKAAVSQRSRFAPRREVAAQPLEVASVAGIILLRLQDAAHLNKFNGTAFEVPLNSSGALRLPRARLVVRLVQLMLILMSSR